MDFAQATTNFLKQDAMIALEQAAWQHTQACKSLEADDGTSATRAQVLTSALLTAGDSLRIALARALTQQATLAEIEAVPDLHPSYLDDVRIGVIQGNR